jgi:hypothetical protein
MFFFLGESICFIYFFKFIKDGFVKIYLDEAQLPVIVPIPKDEVHAQAQDTSNKKANIQSMVSLNKIQWKVKQFIILINFKQSIM